MELVLGVSMAPTSIRMVLVEGENADGVTVEEDSLTVDAAQEAPTLSATDQVVNAIMGTREGAAQAGSNLMSIGVTWTDKVEAAALRDALTARKVENVMLVSAFLAAAALAHTVGSAIGYQHTAMLFVELDTATLAVVDSADGSITDVYRRGLGGGCGADAVTVLIGMIVGVHALPSRPGGVFVVGSGVDITSIKPRLEAATGLLVSAPEEPEMALARGAALASANAPLFASSTAALAYAQDPGTGAVDLYAVAPEHLAVHHAGVHTGPGDDGLLAYSAVPDEDADALTDVLDRPDEWDSGAYDVAAHDGTKQRKPMLLTGSALAATVVTAAALALVITLAINIRTTVALRPVPGQALIVPAAQPPVPALAQVPMVPVAPLHLPAAPPVPARVAIAPAPNLPVPAAPHLPVAPLPAAPPVIVAPVPIAPLPVPVRIPAAAPPVRMPTPQLPLHLPGPQSPIQMQAPQPVQLPNPLQQGQFPNPQQDQFPSPQQGQFPQPQQGQSPGARQGPFPRRGPGERGAQPPRHLPAPEEPRSVPEPQAPRYPTAPQPQTPRFPTMPAPQAPRMPAPVMPRMPSAPVPVAPSMPHLNLPHFRL